VAGVSEATKAGEERAKELLRSGRLVFLKTAGYTGSQILELGDLAVLPAEKMTGLLHSKVVEAFGNALGKTLTKKDLKIRLIGGKKRKKK